MSSKEEILGRIKQNISEKYDMPDLAAIDFIKFGDKLTAFSDMVKGVGGDAIVIQNDQNINDIIQNYFKDAKELASNLEQISVANLNPDQVTTPHELKDVDVAIFRGELGVAENGAVWIQQNVTHKALYFIAENIVIVLDKNKIVNNMHEAYEAIQLRPEIDFGVFISGPSKTADIEQALVLGAHGAKGCLVLLV